MYHRAEDIQREQGLRLKNAELRIEAERLCDEYERLQTENEKLQTENIRLRSWISVDAKSTRQILRENIELRNLFYEAWEWMQYARWHDSICADKLDEIGIKASKLGFPHYELFNCAFAAAEFAPEDTLTRVEVN